MAVLKTKTEILYSDQWGEIIDHPNFGFLEKKWFEITTEMTVGTYNEWLDTFARYIEKTGRPRILIDSIRFGMPMGYTTMAWRDENIIPRYNTAGVDKLAFLMAEGMQLVGDEPEIEEPAAFPTGYFSSRHDALEWLIN